MKTYPNKFAPGDIAIAKQSVVFSDGTCHHTGQRINVTEDDVSYFNVRHHEYEKECAFSGEERWQQIF